MVFMFADQMQFVGWVQSASQHILISNLFSTSRSPADFLQPGIVASGLLVRLGVDATTAYNLWIPIAVVMLFVAMRRMVRASISGLWSRRFALILALFYISPAGALVAWIGGPHWSNFFLTQTVDLEMWPGLYLWGYPFTAIAVAALALGLLAYERDRLRGDIRLAAPLFAMICAWLQPWQGATLIGIVLVTELILRLRGDKGHLALPAIMSLATICPLVYYYLLGHFDPAWATANRANLTALPLLPWQPILISLVPLGLLAVLAYRLPLVDFHYIALRVWPIVALVILCFIAFTHFGTFPLHALQGISIPVAILAVLGARNISLTLKRGTRLAIGSVGLALLVIPSGIHQLQSVWTVGSTTILGPQPVFITAGERSALSYLRENRTPGAVLTSVYLGLTIPAETGRQTWVGSYYWTPNYSQRVAIANKLFSGELSRADALTVVRSTNARFLLSDCYEHVDLAQLLQPLRMSVHHFGCATIYEMQKADQ